MRGKVMERSVRYNGPQLEERSSLKSDYGESCVSHAYERVRTAALNVRAALEPSIGELQ